MACSEGYYVDSYQTLFSSANNTNFILHCQYLISFFAMPTESMTSSPSSPHPLPTTSSAHISIKAWSILKWLMHTPRGPHEVVAICLYIIKTTLSRAFESRTLHMEPIFSKHFLYLRKSTLCLSFCHDGNCSRRDFKIFVSVSNNYS